MPFKPGQSGNLAGKQKGTTNKLTNLVRDLFGDKREEVAAVMLDMALNEKHWPALNFIGERLFPKPRDYSDNATMFDIAEIKSILLKDKAEY